MRQFLFVLALIPSLISCKPIQKIDFTLPAAEETEEFTQVWDSFAPATDKNFTETQQLIDSLQGYTLLFVPGFLSDVVLDFGQWGGAQVTRLGEYFDEQLKWLQDAGLDPVRLEIGSQDSIYINAQKVASFIEASEKPVIIISHSKGSLDTLEGFVSTPMLESKVAGWLTIQAPFYGSPIADAVIEGDLRAFANELLHKLGGTPESLENLNTKDRKAYMSQNALIIESITNAIPILSFASHKDDTNGYDTLLEPLRNFMLDSHEVKNDGLVPWKSAVLPNSSYVHVEGVDHAVPVMYCTFIEYDRVRFLKTTIKMLLNTISDRS